LREEDGLIWDGLVKQDRVSWHEWLTDGETAEMIDAQDEVSKK